MTTSVDYWNKGPSIYKQHFELKMTTKIKLNCRALKPKTFKLDQFISESLGLEFYIYYEYENTCF
jgi:hypothetical protein